MMENKKKFLTAAQLTILIIHLAFMLYFKFDRNMQVERLNKKIEVINLLLTEVSNDLGDFNDAIDKLSK